MGFKEDFIQGLNSRGRTIIPEGIVLHHIDYNKEDVTTLFQNTSGILSNGKEFESYQSSHVVIWKNGDRTKYNEDTQRAWHAGKSRFKGISSCNNFMLGVGFEGNTNKEPLTFKQIQSFIEWFIPRMIEHNIEKSWITDHRTIAPGRKVDLNPIELNRILTAIENLWG